jgi:xanthine dehydrogenase accessory factor
MKDWIHLEMLHELRVTGTPFVEVTLVDAKGSTPGDAGSRMIVTDAGLISGTVGGGRVEARAIEMAQSMLAAKMERTRFVEWNLQTDVGMTCGGIVRLYFELANVLDWRIVIFGAGHVTQALARLLVALPCRVRCIDPRADWLSKLPASIATTCTATPEREVAALPDDAFILCMTRGHRSDFPVLREIYSQPRAFPYVGVIGSRSKAAVLRRELSEAGAAEERLTFRCPVGAPIGSNHPAEIAVSIAAQLLEVRGRGKTAD